MGESKKRVFLGISLSSSERKAVELWQKAARSHLKGNLRWARPEGWHLTLHFIGEMLPESVERLHSLLKEENLGPAGAQALDAWTAFPRPESCRVLVLGGEADPVLAALQVRLGGLLESWGLSVDERPYVPHITLARFRSARSLNFPPPEPPVWIGFNRVTLFESRLGEGGSVYVPLGEFPLAPPIQP